MVSIVVNLVRGAVARAIDLLKRARRGGPDQLTPHDLREIESAASNITVEGARYPEHLEQQTYR